MGRFALIVNKKLGARSRVPLTLSGQEWKPVLTEIKQVYSHVRLNVGYLTGETVAGFSASNVAGLNLSAVSPEVAGAPAIKKIKVNTSSEGESHGA